MRQDFVSDRWIWLLNKILNCNWSWFDCTFTRWCKSGLRFAQDEIQVADETTIVRKTSFRRKTTSKRMLFLFLFFFVFTPALRFCALHNEIEVRTFRVIAFVIRRRVEIAVEIRRLSPWRSFLGLFSSYRVTSDERGGWINGPSSATKERRG